MYHSHNWYILSDGDSNISKFLPRVTNKVTKVSVMQHTRHYASANGLPDICYYWNSGNQGLMTGSVQYTVSYEIKISMRFDEKVNVLRSSQWSSAAILRCLEPWLKVRKRWGILRMYISHIILPGERIFIQDCKTCVIFAKSPKLQNTTEGRFVMSHGIDKSMPLSYVIWRVWYQIIVYADEKAWRNQCMSNQLSWRLMIVS